MKPITCISILTVSCISKQTWTYAKVYTNVIGESLKIGIFGLILQNVFDCIHMCISSKRFNVLVWGSELTPTSCECWWTWKLCTGAITVLNLSTWSSWWLRKLLFPNQIRCIRISCRLLVAHFYLELTIFKVDNNTFIWNPELTVLIFQQDSSPALITWL